jgi:phosphoadenosine phosphosulfate reductase
MLRCNIGFFFLASVDPLKSLCNRTPQDPAVRPHVPDIELEYSSNGADVSHANFLLRAETVTSLAGLSRLSGETLADRLRVVADTIEGRIVFTTSFGVEDQLIAHHIFTERLPIDVVTLDTGRLFPETYMVWQQTEERYAARIRAFYPDGEAVAALVADQGINGFYHSKDMRLACCAVRKVEPLGRALAGASAWVTGLRSDQSEERSEIEFAQWDPEHNLVKIAPLVDYDRARVVAECAKLEVPVNELHSQRFLSIGCAPCTRAIRFGESERAGRWWWERDDSKECGLHLNAAGRLVRSDAA